MPGYARQLEAATAAGGGSLSLHLEAADAQSGPVASIS